MSTIGRDSLVLELADGCFCEAEERVEMLVGVLVASLTGIAWTSPDTSARHVGGKRSCMLDVGASTELWWDE